MTGPKTTTLRTETENRADSVQKCKGRCDYRGKAVLHPRDGDYTLYLCGARLLERFHGDAPCRKGNGISYTTFGLGLCKVEENEFAPKA